MIPAQPVMHMQKKIEPGGEHPLCKHACEKLACPAVPE
jgi:hypothetical protein